MMEILYEMHVHCPEIKLSGVQAQPRRRRPVWLSRCNCRGQALPHPDLQGKAAQPRRRAQHRDRTRHHGR